ncbi:MAG: acyl-CoA dehydrogenase family protein [Rhodospirillaceae bacterium]|nr:acyl-CoA dehydrogenase family protein [Rhodospirillaceae bacterium]
MSVSALQKDQNVTTQDLVARVAALAPKLVERRAKGIALRRLPDETVADLVATGALRACLPKRWGGYELPFGTHTDIAMELARHCGSSGWVAGIIGSHNWWLGKFNPATQEEVLSGRPDALVGAAFASKPGSKAVAKDGGYVVSGEWMWASGVDHCDWCALMTPSPQPSGPPDLLMIMWKRGEYRIKDVWNVPGMKATGSNNAVIDEAFVPASRVSRIADLNSKVSTGQKLNDSWVYRLPMLDVFAYSVAGPTLGCAKGALASFLAAMTSRTALDGAKVADFQSLQLRAAESSAELDAAQALYDADMSFLRAVAQANQDIAPHDILRIKRNCSYIANLSKRAALRLVEAMGAGGVDDANPVQTAFADTMAGAAHRALSWDINASAYGKSLLGTQTSPDDEVLKRQAAAAAALKK